MPAQNSIFSESSKMKPPICKRISEFVKTVVTVLPTSKNINCMFIFSEYYYTASKNRV